MQRSTLIHIVKVACLAICLSGCAHGDQSDEYIAEPIDASDYQAMGKNLRAEIFDRYKNPGSSNINNSTMDIKDVFQKYIKIGDPFDKAEAILRGAHFKMAARPNKHTMGTFDEASIVASDELAHKLFQLVGVQIILIPQLPGKLKENRVADIDVVIYLSYL